MLLDLPVQRRSLKTTGSLGCSDHTVVVCDLEEYGPVKERSQDPEI